MRFKLLMGLMLILTMYSTLACVTPIDNMTLTEDTVFCPGTYNASRIEVWPGVHLTFNNTNIFTDLPSSEFSFVRILLMAANSSVDLAGGRLYCVGDAMELVDWGAEGISLNNDAEHVTIANGTIEGCPTAIHNTEPITAPYMVVENMYINSSDAVQFRSDYAYYHDLHIIGNNPADINDIVRIDISGIGVMIDNITSTGGVNLGRDEEAQFFSGTYMNSEAYSVTALIGDYGSTWTGTWANRSGSEYYVNITNNYVPGYFWLEGTTNRNVWIYNNTAGFLEDMSNYYDGSYHYGENTEYINYCVDGVGNTFGGYTGTDSNLGSCCIIPQSTQLYQREVHFCPGNYDVNNIQIGENSTVFLNNTNLYSTLDHTSNDGVPILSIVGNNVVIDGNNNMISCVGDGAGYEGGGLFAISGFNYNNLEIKNLNTENCYYGIFTEGMNNSYYHDIFVNNTVGVRFSGDNVVINNITKTDSLQDFGSRIDVSGINHTISYINTTNMRLGEDTTTYAWSGQLTSSDIYTVGCGNGFDGFISSRGDYFYNITGNNFGYFFWCKGYNNSNQYYYGNTQQLLEDYSDYNAGESINFCIESVGNGDPVPDYFGKSPTSGTCPRYCSDGLDNNWCTITSNITLVPGTNYDNIWKIYAPVDGTWLDCNGATISPLPISEYVLDIRVVSQNFTIKNCYINGIFMPTINGDSFYIINNTFNSTGILSGLSFSAYSWGTFRNDGLQEDMRIIGNKFYGYEDGLPAWSPLTFKRQGARFLNSLPIQVTIQDNLFTSGLSFIALNPPTPGVTADISGNNISTLEIETLGPEINLEEDNIIDRIMIRYVQYGDILFPAGRTLNIKEGIYLINHPTIPIPTPYSVVGDNTTLVGTGECAFSVVGASAEAPLTDNTITGFSVMGYDNYICFAENANNNTIQNITTDLNSYSDLGVSNQRLSVTVTNRLPNKPVITSPENNSRIATPTAPLHVTATDDNNDTLTIEFYIDGVNPPSTIRQSSTDKNYNFNPGSNGIYYVRVRSHDGTGFSEWSDVLRFEIRVSAGGGGTPPTPITPEKKEEVIAPAPIPPPNPFVELGDNIQKAVEDTREVLGITEKDEIQLPQTPEEKKTGIGTIIFMVIVIGGAFILLNKK